MILIKSFFRKKKTFIYLRIIILIIVILLLLNGINSFINKELDRIKYENSSLLMFSLNKQSNILNKEKRVLSYNRLLAFEKGEDNNILYTPIYIENDNGSISYEKPDYSKIEWNSLIYNEDKYPFILAFPSAYCDEKLKDNEVILALEEDIDYRKELKEKYLKNKISFKHQKEEIVFSIKNIIEPKTFKYICISNNLYNKFSQKENKYIYLINTNNYKNMESLKKEWKNLEKNNFYSITNNSDYSNIEINNRKTSLTNLANILQKANIISFIIFIIVILLVIKDLCNDEGKDIVLLKQLGFNKNQIFKFTIIKIILFNIITFLFSILIILFFNMILNILLTTNYNFYSINHLLYIELLITIFELFFSKKKINKQYKVG